MGITLLLGCGLTPAERARADLYSCRVAAIAPSCEPALDAADLVRDAVLGKLNLIEVLLGLGNTRAEVDAAIERAKACDAGQPPVDPLPASKGMPL